MKLERSDLPIPMRTIPALRDIFYNPRDVPAIVGLLPEEMVAMIMLGFVSEPRGFKEINTIPVFVYDSGDCNELRDFAFNLLERAPDEDDT